MHHSLHSLALIIISSLSQTCSLKSYPAIDTIGLRECRLTGKSLPSIVAGFSAQNLLQMDLSYNNLHKAGASALAAFFASGPTNVISMTLSRCDLRCSDVSDICRGLTVHSMGVNKKTPTHKIQELYLDSNKIKSEGAKAICNFLQLPGCELKILDLTWNMLGVSGAIHIADALQFVDKSGSSSCRLQTLLLSCNGIGDEGAQCIAASVARNISLIKLNLASNGVGTNTCFIFSSALNSHRTMRLLDLSSNPLGDSGARCLFKIILRRIPCFIIMKNCTFVVEPGSYDISNPAALSPYELDTSDPYQEAVMQELFNTYVVDTNHLSFDIVSVREKNTSAKQSDKNTKMYGSETFHKLMPLSGQVVNQSSKLPWIPPHGSLVKITCSQQKEKPPIALKLSAESLEIFIIIIANAGSEIDRNNWFRLMSTDHYFTTAQVDQMIESFAKQMVQISAVDIFGCLWTKLLDTENKFESMCKHLNSDDRHELVNICAFEKFRFNWVNCTGHWHLDLGNPRQREVIGRVARR